ncbi:UNVERIFIED_CONTAM: FMN-dependent NADH-azoreductase AzoR3, partial [Pseudomonas aeruginosa]|nr:FMN-dependent NADH-azoreductase AzoR3 [Pseudomonas aeruginosa]
LRQVLGFVGIHDVTFIHAEGMNMGPEFREKGLARARERMRQALETDTSLCVPLPTLR